MCPFIFTWLSFHFHVSFSGCYFPGVINIKDSELARIITVMLMSLCRAREEAKVVGGRGRKEWKGRGGLMEKKNGVMEKNGVKEGRGETEGRERE